MHGKIIEFEKKTEESWKNHGILLNNLMKPPVARKLAVKHTSIVLSVYWWFQV